jgi:hypothetical protein
VKEDANLIDLLNVRTRALVRFRRPGVRLLREGHVAVLFRQRRFGAPIAGLDGDDRGLCFESTQIALNRDPRCLGGRPLGVGKHPRWNRLRQPCGEHSEVLIKNAEDRSHASDCEIPTVELGWRTATGLSADRTKT